MSAKTTFWYGLVVALAVVGSAVALPLSTSDDSASENVKTVMLPEQPKDQVATETVQPTGQTEELAAVSTDPSSVSQTVNIESDDDGSTSAVAATSTSAAAATSTSADAGVQQTENVAGSTPSAAESATGSDRSEPTTTAAAADATSTATGTDSQEPTTTGVPSPVTGVPYGFDQRPRPYYVGGAQTVQNAGPSIPFYLEFFQPFQPLPVQPYPNRPNHQPFRHQPFGAVIDPFNPFENSPISPFNQIIETYTNEFRKMLESFDQNMQRIPQQVENFDNTQSGSNKPVSKTTSKTEIINGHVVQINETTYSNGDENHKSFYHFKEIQVLPEANNKKIANEKVSSITNDDSEKIELNEIKRDPIESFDDVPKSDIQPNIVKKVE